MVIPGVGRIQLKLLMHIYCDTPNFNWIQLRQVKKLFNFLLNSGFITGIKWYYICKQKISTQWGCDDVTNQFDHNLHEEIQYIAARSQDVIVDQSSQAGFTILFPTSRTARGDSSSIIIAVIGSNNTLSNHGYKGQPHFHLKSPHDFKMQDKRA